MMFFLVIIASVLFTSCSMEPDYLNEKFDVDVRVEDLLSRLTLEEKISLTHANGLFTVGGIERLGIPLWNLSDGPHGVREEINRHDWGESGWTTDSASYFPTGTALSATWNPQLSYKFGQALGREARARDKDVILGPGINIMRTPLNGRNFEYMGEDPYLASKLAVPYIKGVQEQDVAASLKHYALNNQEYERFKVDVLISERALQEIYLPGYEAAVKEGGALTVMAGYNKLRGDWCAENKYLLNDILKDQWGFKGAVISDWDGTHSTVKAALAGLDVEMGTKVENYDDWYFARALLEAVKNGEVAPEIVDDKARRVLRVMISCGVLDKNRKKGSFTPPEHFQLARKVAEEAVVLLKNEKQFLPLNSKKIKSIAVIGDNATRKHAKEGGSSGVKALYEVTPLQGLQNKLSDDVKLLVAQGYKRTTEFSWEVGITDSFDTAVAKKLRNEAVAAAKKADMAIVFGGLNHHFDCEAWDRKDMKLPFEQDKLIREVARANPNTVVVLVSGAPVEMSEWLKKVPAVVQGWYAGMEAGNVFADILFGDVNPSGKLTFTFPKKLADSPAHANGNYPGVNSQVSYDEGIMVGYRYFDTESVEPLFAFGHGLSYTQFNYSDIQLTEAGDDKSLPLEVRFNLNNTGERPGAEVVQLYVSDPQSSVVRPLKELKGFDKIELQAGQEKEILFKLDRKAFSFYDTESSSWKAEPGLFKILIGASSQDIRLSGEFELKE